MRWLVATVVVIGCGSPGDELKDLESHATQCGVVNPSCGTGIPTADAVACMNDALKTGAVAEAGWDEYFDDYDLRQNRVFVDGGRVRVFVDSEDPFGGPNEVVEDPSCAGPFEVAATTVCGVSQGSEIDGITVDGC